jgi:hypothetical protein
VSPPTRIRPHAADIIRRRIATPELSRRIEITCRSYSKGGAGSAHAAKGLQIQRLPVGRAV